MSTKRKRSVTHKRTGAASPPPPLPPGPVLSYDDQTQYLNWTFGPPDPGGFRLERNEAEPPDWQLYAGFYPPDRSTSETVVPGHYRIAANDEYGVLTSLWSNTVEVPA